MVTGKNAPARLVLASASPRRRQLLEAAGLTFDVEPSGVPEDIADGNVDPAAIALGLARLKAREVARRRSEPALVLAADTVVVLEGRLLAKPVDADEARSMLSALRDREHEVITGVALLRPGGRPLEGHASTLVRMRAYGTDEVEASIARGDPFDKAGGYAIQDERLAPVVSYQGCYCNVVGLPVGLVAALLARAGSKQLPRRPLPQCDACPLWVRVEF